VEKVPRAKLHTQRDCHGMPIVTELAFWTPGPLNQ
jgi:hypothetical protein